MLLIQLASTKIFQLNHYSKYSEFSDLTVFYSNWEQRLIREGAIKDSFIRPISHLLQSKQLDQIQKQVESGGQSFIHQDKCYTKHEQL